MYIKALSWSDDRMVVGFTINTYMQSLPTTTKVVSWNHAHGEVYSIQHYVIKFVSDLQQVCGFLRVLLVSSTNKASCLTKILLNVVLNIITLTPNNAHHEK
jgi:hypothetical protein